MRKVADCREMPSESGCSLMIAGEEDEVLRAAVEHAVSTHGHTDSPELREMIRRGLKDETGHYGSIMIGKRKAPVEEMERAAAEWERERQVPGFLRDETLVADDGETIVVAVHFASREDYERLGQDAAQAEWWTTKMAPLLDGEPQWIDGEWRPPIDKPVMRLPSQATSATERQRATT